MKKNKPQTIRHQIQKIMVLMMAVTLSITCCISSVLTYVIMEDTLEKSMTETANVAAYQLQYKLQTFIDSVEALGGVTALSSDTVSDDEKLAIADSYVKHYGWHSVYLTDKTGNLVGFDKGSLADMDYFKKAIKGDTVISEPVYDGTDGSYVLVIAAPLYKDGVLDSEPVGTACATIDAMVFVDLASKIKVSPNGASYMIDQDGNTIAHADYDLIINQSNTINDAKTDKGLTDLADLERKMIAGENGFGTYSYGGTSKYMAYAPVGINGWSIAVTAPYSDFSQGAMLGLILNISLAVLATIIAIFIARRFGNRIGSAIAGCAERLGLLAKGNLDIKVPETDARNETKLLTDSTATIVKTQQDIIGDIRYLLHELAEGNFNVTSQIGQDAYVGSYIDILQSMRDLRDNMAETLRSIVDNAEQVQAGASQLADASQNLAEGAVEQTMAMDDLLQTVTGVSAQVENNNKATDNAHGQVQLITEAANISNAKMQELASDMKGIEEAAGQISHIISEIENIATQTNLLSLNASIEAAHAGDAGRGFNVVAENIGTLAKQCSESAVNTRRLIEATIEEINKGSKATGETMAQMEQVLEGISRVSETLTAVKTASNEQTEAVIHIQKKIDDISNVTTSNSAVAEESSATSEELSAQAQSMEALVSRFKLPR